MSAGLPIGTIDMSDAVNSGDASEDLRSSSALLGDGDLADLIANVRAMLEKVSRAFSVEEPRRPRVPLIVIGRETRTCRMTVERSRKCTQFHLAEPRQQEVMQELNVATTRDLPAEKVLPTVFDEWA